MRDPLDYSPHMIGATQLLRHIHGELLKHNYDEAISKVDEAIAELRLAKAAMIDTKERWK